LSINAGAGGTESATGQTCSCGRTSAGQSRALEVDVTDVLVGENTGIKSATMLIEGENAYGFCKAERGVHRLVRISPFDSNSGDIRVLRASMPSRNRGD